MKLIPVSVTNRIGRQVLTLQKNSPRFLFVGGLVGVVGAAVLASRATLKLEGKLTDMKLDIDSVKDRQTASEAADRRLPAVDYRKDLALVYFKGTTSIAKLYAPAIILGGASIAALTGSHVTLTRRNNSLMAAYSAVASSYEAYRERVKDELGAEKELDIYHAARIENVSVDEKVKKLRVADPNKWSPYAKFFDESNVNWQKNAELNRMFVTCQQTYANNLLQARGHIFLNEVYDMLGFDHTSAGAVVGWVLGEDGDNFVDFGMFEAASARFINGIERSIILDFNVDGVIFDKI